MFNAIEATKRAEVRGCMAGFVDAGLVKVASAEEFENLCDAVANRLDSEYDLTKVAEAADAVLNGSDETARNAALGELLLMKTAGEIDNNTFVETAQEIMKLGGTSARELADMYESEGRKVPGKVQRAKGYEEAMIEEGRKVKPYGTDAAGPRSNKSSLAKRLKGVGKSIGDAVSKNKKALGIGGGALAGTAAAAYLGKKLYDKYAN